jgi:fatty-acyl-CoA synthase
MDAVITLPQALSAAALGDKGYRFLGARGVESRTSHAEMYSAALRVAGGLAALGLHRGDPIAIIVSDSEGFLRTLFGASIAGVIPASLYPPASTGELALYLESTARAARRASRDHVAGARAHIDTLRESCPDLAVVVPFDALDGPPAAGDFVPAPDDIAFVQFTSGSTSTPKGVVITQRNLAANIAAFSGPAGLHGTADDIAVSWLPLYHDMGLVGMALGSLYVGDEAIVMTPEAFVKRPIEWLRAISKYKATVSFAPNFAYDLAVRRVKDADLADLDLSSWRVAGCGAEPIHLGGEARRHAALVAGRLARFAQPRPRRDRARDDGAARTRAAGRAAGGRRRERQTRGHACQRHAGRNRLSGGLRHAASRP